MSGVSYSLSEKDIRKVLKSVPFVPYPKLENVEDITQLLNKSKCFVLFFEEDKEGGTISGHYECVFMEDNKTIVFFDSYGLQPDQCKKWLSKNNLMKLKETPDYLSNLLNKASDDGYVVKYSPYKYQQMKSGINTCGRFVTCRLLYKNMNGDQFKKVLDNMKKDYKVKSYDQAVTLWMNDKYDI